MSLAALFGSWRAERGRAVRARQYVTLAMAEPTGEAVRALASAGDGDEDHARWELRYARRAVALLVSERDALDDRTGSDVAAALEIAHRGDLRVAPDRREIAERQLNDRLLEYRAALHDRSGTSAAAERLGRVLLKFARASAMPPPSVAMAADLAGTMVGECNQALREKYGEASLPENIRPSEL